SSCKLFQYADDTVLLSQHLDYVAGITLLQDDTCHLHDWFRANCLTINIHKTKLVCFHNPLKLITTDYPLYMHTSHCSLCYCNEVPYSDTVKYLGIHFDSDLSWNSHLTKLCAKLRSISCLLYNTKAFMPFILRKRVTYALAYSNLRYGITIFGKCSKLWQKKINSVLRGILRSVGYKRDFSDLHLFQTLSMPTFQSLFLETVVLNYNWKDDFKSPRPISRNLRKASRFLTPICYTRYSKNMR
ncbi:uncharacterized protein LOC120837087, partial [Ixodes scapularis]|uniref:uncharacterized protein LOC120837087 n=1 Tax=Ixodes scapularis TaxID=6945 RepID=UPI001A9FF310